MLDFTTLNLTNGNGTQTSSSTHFPSPSLPSGGTSLLRPKGIVIIFKDLYHKTQHYYEEQKFSKFWGKNLEQKEYPIVTLKVAELQRKLNKLRYKVVMMDIDAIPDHEDKNMKTLRNWTRICLVKIVVLI